MSKAAYITICIISLASCTDSDEPAITSSYDHPTIAEPIPIEAAPLETDGSIATLTAEIRQLRAAIDNLARNQKEAQTLSILVQAQQNRIDQTSSQLDAVREEIKSTTEQIQNIETTIVNLSDKLMITTERNDRNQFENMVRDLKTEQEVLEKTLLGNRDQEEKLSRELQIEEAQWNTLVSKFD